MTTPDERLTAATFRFAQAARAMHDAHCSCAATRRPCDLAAAYAQVEGAIAAAGAEAPTTDPDRPPPTIDGITLTADELDALTAWSKASTRGGFRVWLEHDTAVEAATRILAERLDPIAAELSNTQADLDRARERLHRLAGKAGHQPNPADNDASYELSIQLAIEGGQR